MRLYIFYFITIAVIISSCSHKQYQVLFEKKAPVLNDTSTEKKAFTANTYRIMPQDLLQIRNLQNIKIVDDGPSGGAGASALQTQTYQVEEDGTVTLPILGHVPINGLTRTEAARHIEDLYRKFLTNPIIELKVVNLKVTILGEIKAQGNYPLLKDNTTLVDIIGQAGGLTAGANEKTVKIIRGNQQNQKVSYIDLSDIRSINNPDAVMQNGDIIYIAQNKRAVRTDNLSSFSTVIQPLLIIFNTALIIYTLTR